MKDKEKNEITSFRRFRMGHSTDLRGYQKRIGMSEDERCRRCSEDDESSNHVLIECAAMERVRREENIEGLEDLTGNAEGYFRLWRG